VPSSRHRPLEELALVLFAGAIPYAALAFGSTTYVTRLVLDGILLAGSLVVLLGGMGRSRNPHSLRNLKVLSGLLAGVVVLGSISLLNPKYEFDPRLEAIEPLPHAIGFLPGTYDVSRTLPEVGHIFCLSVALLSFTVLLRSSDHRWIFLKTIASTGFLIAVIGIYQKVTGTVSMLWTTNEYDPTFFAAFRYHGNAAAFLNLCWPASLALVFRVIRDDPRNLVAKTWWICCLAFTFGGLLVNTSKYGHIIAFVCVLVAMAVGVSRIPRMEGKGRAIGVSTVVLVLALLAVMSLFSGEQIFSKWDEAMANGVSLKRRIMAYGTAIQMWQDAPIWGYGAGCFGLLFRFYSVSSGRELGGKWTFAHNDYLQTLTEWGIVGAVLIFAVFGIGIFFLWKQVRRSRWESLTAVAAFLALLLISLHVFVDFSLQIGAMQVIALVYLSFGWAGPPERAHRRRKKRRHLRRRRRSSRLSRHSGEASSVHKNSP